MADKNDTAIIRSSDDSRFLRDIDRGNLPVLVFFHQPDDEACEFNEMVVTAFAQSQKRAVSVLTCDKSANPEINDRFSLPDGPVLMLIRNKTILGYSRNKLTAARLEQWFDETVEKDDADGVTIDDFMTTLEKKKQRQKAAEEAAVRRARRNHYIGAALRVAGGLIMAGTMPVPGMGLAGVAIAAYTANRAFSVYADPEKRAPQPPKTMVGKILRTAMDGVTLWSSFSLVALAFNTMSGMAFAGTMAAAVTMMAHGSMGLGRLIPPRFLIGSLRKDMEDIARRDPTKPLDEFSPVAPQPEFERAPAKQNPAAQNDADGVKTAAKDFATAGTAQDARPGTSAKRKDTQNDSPAPRP